MPEELNPNDAVNVAMLQRLVDQMNSARFAETKSLVEHMHKIHQTKLASGMFQSVMAKELQARMSDPKLEAVAEVKALECIRAAKVFDAVVCEHLCDGLQFEKLSLATSLENEESEVETSKPDPLEEKSEKSE